MKPLAYFLFVFLLTACDLESPSNRTTKTDSVPVIDTVMIVDTAAIEKKIRDQYEKRISYYDSSRKENSSYWEYSGDIECKLNLNGDQWLDFFVIEFTMGGGPTNALFYDGKTGELIDYYDGTTMIWSRPGVEIEYEIINVDCNDNQQEMLIRYGSGGNAGCYYDCQVYRYDHDSSEVKLIFQQTISAYTIDLSDGTPGLNERNYIDINYNNDSCINDIRVQKGESSGEVPCYSIDVQPGKNGMMWRYSFNEEKNEFVLRDSVLTKK